MNKNTITATINNNIDLSKDVRLLNIKTPINQKFVPTFDDLKMYDDIMNTVIFNGIHEKIAKHSLNMLYSKGNLSAYEILTTGTAIIDFDDISQEILVKLYEYRDCLAIIDGQFTITDDNAIKAVYGACSRFMYSFMQKHYKHAFIEIDGQTIDIFNTRALAQFADYNDVIAMDVYKSFIEIVKKQYPKDLARVEKIVKMRISGYTFAECAEKLHCTKSCITKIQYKISECARMLYR